MLCPPCAAPLLKRGTVDSIYDTFHVQLKLFMIAVKYLLYVYVGSTIGVTANNAPTLRKKMLVIGWLTGKSWS